MHLTVNGHAHTLPEATTLTHLLEHLQLDGRLALEVNRRVIPRSRWSEHSLHDGDRIEVVRAIGGG